jgi:hypothetical protein
MLTACSLHASQSSSTTASAVVAPAAMISSVIRTTQVKQPNAIDFAQSLLKKATITRVERDKAIALLEAAMPLTLIEEARRTPIKLSDEYKAVNAQSKKSLDVDAYCNETLTKLLGFRDEFKGEFEKAQYRLTQLNRQNGQATASRTSTLLQVLDVTIKMLLEKEPTIQSDDEQIKAAQRLFYEISVSDQLQKRAVNRNNGDDPNDDNDLQDDDFVEIQRLADEKFQEAKQVEEDRIRCIVTKYQQLCTVIGVMAPLSETLKKEARHHEEKATRVNFDIDNARARHEEAQQVLKTNTALIAQLQKKPLS